MDTIYGYPILAEFTCRQPLGFPSSRLILVDTGKQPVLKSRYVTALVYENDKHWNAARYFVDYLGAAEDFFERCRRDIAGG